MYYLYSVTSTRYIVLKGYKSLREAVSILAYARMNTMAVCLKNGKTGKRIGADKALRIHCRLNKLDYFRENCKERTSTQIISLLHDRKTNKIAA